MTAPAGTEVGLYVDLVARVEANDVIETCSGRRYMVVSVRVQDRGKHRGRQHLRALVLPPDTMPIIARQTTASTLGRRVCTASAGTRGIARAVA